MESVDRTDKSLVRDSIEHLMIKLLKRGNPGSDIAFFRATSENNAPWISSVRRFAEMPEVSMREPILNFTVLPLAQSVISFRFLFRRMISSDKKPDHSEKTEPYRLM